MLTLLRMKRWALGSIVFFISFGLGLAVAEMLQQPMPALGELDENGEPKTVGNEPAMTRVADSEPPSDVLIESFTNKSRIGRPRNNKVVLHCLKRENDFVAKIEFYSRSTDGKWKQTQSFEFEKDSLTGCQPEIKDFNNDGLRDFTYQSNVAARGANEIRTLFIYDKKKDKFVHIKNSADYPNLMYNERLDCLDAWLFHGATTTVFLRIEGDMLKEFASVDTGAELVVTVTTEKEKRVLRREKMNPDDVYTRYIDFDPPIWR